MEEEIVVSTEVVAAVDLAGLDEGTDHVHRLTVLAKLKIHPAAIDTFLLGEIPGEILGVAIVIIPVADLAVVLLYNRQPVLVPGAVLGLNVGGTAKRGTDQWMALRTVRSATVHTRTDLEDHAGHLLDPQSAAHPHLNEGGTQLRGIGAEAEAGAGAGAARRSAEDVVGIPHPHLPGPPSQGVLAGAADATTRQKLNSVRRRVVGADPIAEVLHQADLIEEGQQMVKLGDGTVPPHLYHPHLFVASLLIFRKMTVPRRKSRALLRRKAE